MIIGLVRHFLVLQPYLTRQRMNSEEYVAWCQAYEAADVLPNPCDLGGIAWDTCYASDLTRAVVTARTLFPGEVRVTPLLREINLDPFLHTRLRLPFRFWDSGGRLAWYFSHRSQTESRRLVEARIHAFLDQVLDGVAQNILVVSHGGLMWFLRRELEKLGFRGEKFTTAENGRLYRMENEG
jgi:broad specificity phosphatase PhoE